MSIQIVNWPRDIFANDSIIRVHKSGGQEHGCNLRQISRFRDLIKLTYMCSRHLNMLHGLGSRHTEMSNSINTKKGMYLLLQLQNE